MTPEQYKRFRQKIWPDYVTKCWVWIGGLDCNRQRYGAFRISRDRVTKAHIASYEHHVGPVPDGLELDHLCRVRLCVNPDHLEPVTTRENIRRGRVGDNMREKTHCPAGHAYEGDNLLIVKTKKRVFRGCRTCRNAAANRFYWRRRDGGGNGNIHRG